MTRRRIKARRDRRGRPKQANAKRRATTLAGRRPEIDHGTAELRRHRAAVTGQADLPDDLLGALYGRGIIDQEGYTAGRCFAELVRLVRLGFGLTEASPAGAWRNILTAAHSSNRLTADGGIPGAERARRALARFRSDLGRAAWRAVSAAADNIWPVRDVVQFLKNLAIALNYLVPRLPLPIKSVG